MKSFQIIIAVILVSMSCVVGSASAANVNGASNKGGGGFFGYELIEAAETIPEFTFMAVEAECSFGKKILGGGWTLVSGGDFEVYSLGPSADGAGYFLEIVSNSEEPQEVIVTAICANVSKKPN